MITDQQAHALATLIASVRPGWALSGIAASLKRCPEPIDELTMIAFRAAGDPMAQTPAAIVWPKYRTPTTISSKAATTLREPKCYICGHPQSKCEEIRDREIARGVPDPHEFETMEDAERKAVPTPDYIREALPKLLKRVDDG
jgi:hypothetical protein